MLRLECVGGCSCEPTVIDTLTPDRKFATLDSTAIPVTQSARCRLRLVNVSPAARAGCKAPPCTKLKLVALSVSGALGASGGAGTSSQLTRLGIQHWVA